MDDILKILVIESHGEQFRISGQAGIKLYSDFERILKGNGYELKAFKKGNITEYDLQDYNVIIVSLGTKTYEQGEILSIKNFVNNGHGLFIIGGVNYSPPLSSSFDIAHLNSLTSHFGIIFESQPITAGKGHMKETTRLITEKASETVPLITKLGTHPITSGVNELIYGGVGMQISKEVIGIATSDEDTVPPNRIVLSAIEYGKGRVVALGSSQLFLRMSFMKISMPFGLQKSDHVVLATNILNWLSFRDR